MLARDHVGGERKLAPFNLVSSWYWTAGPDSKRIEPERLEMVRMSAGMGERFAQVASEITDRIKKQFTRPQTGAKSKLKRIMVNKMIRYELTIQELLGE